MKRVVGAVAATLLVVLTGGCSGASNSGADTTCSEFLSKRDEDKDATVARMLKERIGRNSSTGDVVNKRLAIVEACGAGDKQSVKIGDLG